MGETHQLAHQVCFNCKCRKRKCTKELPSCQLCSKYAESPPARKEGPQLSASRSLIACNYQYGNLSTQRSDALKQISSSPTIGSQFDLHIFPGAPPFARSQSLSNFDMRSLSEHILNYLMDTGESIPSITAIYFRTIDIWLPIVSRERILREFERSGNYLSNDHAILLLCMYLVTRIPGSGGQDTMMTSMYLHVKSLYSVQASSGESGVELVQAGLLICLYEQGHGLFENALMTIAGISRLGMRMLSAHLKKGESNIQNTELGHLWWGIVIMDRFTNLGVEPEDIHLGMGTQSRNCLPLPDGLETAAQMDIEGSSTNMQSGIHVGTQPTNKPRPFCRTAEASQLLGRVLEFLSRVKSNFEDNELEKAQQLDQALQELAMALMQQATDGWEECCASISICFSALLTLHTRIRDIIPQILLDAGETADQENLMAIKAAVRILIDISRRFHADRAYIDLPALPLPSTFSIYQAALLHIKYSGDEFTTQEWKYDMGHVKKSLTHFSKRWDVCRMSLPNFLQLRGLTDTIQENISVKSISLLLQKRNDVNRTSKPMADSPLPKKASPELVSGPQHYRHQTEASTLHHSTSGGTHSPPCKMI